MTLNINAFSEVLDILKTIFAGIKSASQLPENNRKEMRDALADTAQLVDETITIVKQHLTVIISELKFGDTLKAQRMVSELGHLPEWESKYRRFQLCESLRKAVFDLEKKGVYRLLNHLSFSNRPDMNAAMNEYLGGEANAARSVRDMLQELSRLAGDVDTDPAKVIGMLEVARDEVGKWRQAFIDLELEIRDFIK